MRLVSEDTERAAWARYAEVVAPFKRDYDDAIREAGRIFRQRTAAAWAELMQELGLFRGS